MNYHKSAEQSSVKGVGVQGGVESQHLCIYQVQMNFVNHQAIHLYFDSDVDFNLD